jgi:hypothetical protein
VYSLLGGCSVVGITTACGLDGEGVGVRVPVGSIIFSLQVVRTGSGVHPTSYPMGAEGSFPGGQSGRGVKLTTHGQENVDLFIHSPIRLHGAVLNS